MRKFGNKKKKTFLDNMQMLVAKVQEVSDKKNKTLEDYHRFVDSVV